MKYCPVGGEARAESRLEVIYHVLYMYVCVYPFTKRIIELGADYNNIATITRCSHQAKPSTLNACFIVTADTFSTILFFSPQEQL